MSKNTNDLWVPIFKPPLIDADVAIDVAQRVLHDGPTELILEGMSLMLNRHEPFAERLDILGNQLNALSSDGDWPKYVLRASASIALIAYQQTGYCQTIDSAAMELGDMAAEIDGIPETFVVSLALDRRLRAVADVVLRSDEFRDPDGGFLQIFNIGAGSARHYLQQAVAA